MKYNNNSAEPPEKGKILHFIQQFRIWGDKRREMLYYVQDFMTSYQKSATKSR
ncbi:hypothetical protein [Paenibacillus borealis]|uniref:hypothetical protein n=1 Tax=Paenibacillus borealis TaxID=160799 RepID=UPI000ADF75CA|nr:hypothetical protein [Paenibacillus borealis]